ncbi:hypothetical protein KUTeg_020944 [Tegillarca granosa]|uniref:Uncharacterized protein n=1 Tax=Tegillarca granosa TaxID=220873 RepID=A0ABQ9E9G1_TEGGR|nr:hypothetical protein KUTeg_020944 [Tegillarca granosa]
MNMMFKFWREYCCWSYTKAWFSERTYPDRLRMTSLHSLVKTYKCADIPSQWCGEIGTIVYIELTSILRIHAPCILYTNFPAPPPYTALHYSLGRDRLDIDGASSNDGSGRTTPPVRDSTIPPPPYTVR